MLSIGTSIAPSQNKLNYFLFFKEAGNILPLKKQYPASPGTRVLLAFRGYSCSLNDTCPRVPCMAGGLAESLCQFIGLAVGETAAILSAAKGGMRRGKTSDGDTRVKRIWMPPERLPSLMPYRGVELEL
jgi:hypothetical protein